MEVKPNIKKMILFTANSISRFYRFDKLARQKFMRFFQTKAGKQKLATNIKNLLKI